MLQEGAYIHCVEPSHLTRWTVLRILAETEPMTMSDAMISALLVAQFRRFRLLALARLGGVASRAPWGNRVKKSAWRSHRTLPVDGPEEIEARQCGIWVVIIDIAATRQVQLRIST